MRKQFQNLRFSLVLGSGVSKPLGTPTWKELNRLVSEDLAVQGQECCDDEVLEPMITQRLYEHYKLKKLTGFADLEPREAIKKELKVYGEFKKILYKNLYRNRPKESKKIKSIHPYLENYLTVLRNTNITINYNFDNYIERLLHEERTKAEKKSTKGYYSATNINIPFRHDKRVIYHPNGFLPHKEMEAGGSPDLIFSENEFAEQLLGVMSGHYSSLVHHFCNNTCLFIGLSLDDPTLKHLLKLVVRMNPARCHYFVYYYENETSKPSRELQKAIFAANFETYNLVTLFLCDKEIAALGDLLESGFYETEKKDSEISLLASELGVSLKYSYYIVGCIGVGKSTTITHFRDATTYDEWFEPRELDLGKEPENLDTKQTENVDKWIVRQFYLKNHKIYEETSGIILIDRCPLDPITFTPYDKWTSKADSLLTEILKGAPKIVRGHVILLLDDPAILEMRLIAGPKEYTEERLKRLQDDIKKVYNFKDVSKIDAKYMTKHEIIKRVAKIIHAEEYKEINIQNKIEEIKNDKSE